MERTLLLVDDEENIVRSLSRLFRRDGYTIVCANSGQEGLDILRDTTVGVIVSDQRMPQMTGVEFLRQVKDLYPNTVRIVLSGYTELESVTKAINEGAIYKFLTKPWDDDLLRKNIREAFDHFELEEENRRLNEELRVANEELSALNQDLEKRVQGKTREVIVNLQVLQISQEVFEHLPMGIIGIDSEGMIVVANHRAQNLLSPTGTSPVGAMAEGLLPEGIYEALNAFPDDASIWNCGSVDCNGVACELTISLLSGESRDRGLVMMLNPRNEALL